MYVAKFDGKNPVFTLSKEFTPCEYFNNSSSDIDGSFRDAESGRLNLKIPFQKPNTYAKIEVKFDNKLQWLVS